MAGVPSKAQELVNLCLALRRQDIHFFAIAPWTRGSLGSPGQPDIVVMSLAGTPLAVWLRKADRRSPALTRSQQVEMERAAMRGWSTVIAYGATEALQEIHCRGVNRGKHASLAI